MFDSIDDLTKYIDSNPSIQGHICINNDGIFDYCLMNQVYGFPGTKITTLDNMKTTTWRSIASLNNIGPNDLIFLYRTSGDSYGCQEFHGVFKIQEYNGEPLILFHPEDTDYLPSFREGQLLPFRFLFQPMLENVLSIPNDLRNQNYKKNNNLEIIKALSESDPSKDRLWGFRHPAVMNIGAARKSSIVAISNKQTRFLASLLRNGVKRKQIMRNQSKIDVSEQSNCYDSMDLPENCYLIDDSFISGQNGLEKFYEKGIIKFEALLYAYIIRGFKQPNSEYQKEILEDFSFINNDINLESMSENCILEVVVTPHIQEEIDILLCDRQERNFLIFEIKQGQIKHEDIEQAEKYIQLVKQKFPNYQKVSANVVGLRKESVTNTEDVKGVYYQMKKSPDYNVYLKFKLN